MSTKRRGRPLETGARRSVRIAFRVTPQEREAIRALAKENQATLGEWCRFGALAQQAECADEEEWPVVVIGGRIMQEAIIRRA